MITCQTSSDEFGKVIRRIFAGKGSNANKANQLASRPDEQTLIGGVPPWMYPSVWEWIFAKFLKRDIFNNSPFLDLGLAREVERTFRLSFGQLDPFYDPASSFLVIQTSFSDPDKTINLLGFLLKRSSHEDAIKLMEILHQSGSMWSVIATEKGWELVQRVEDLVEQSKNDMPRGLAQDLLSEAWLLAYGQNPRPSSAYAQAIKAMEAILGELVEPNNKRSTFGTIISKFREQRWGISADAISDLGTNTLLVDLCNLAWKGQADRHATDAETFRNVTQSEAELAISVALFVIHAANRGNIKREL